MTRNLLLVTMAIFASNLNGSRFFGEHPAKKPMQKQRQENVWSCDLFLALEWQIHDRIKTMVQDLENSGESIATADFVGTVLDVHKTVISIIDSMLCELQISIAKTGSTWKMVNSRNLSVQESFIVKLACEIHKAQDSIVSRLGKINTELIDKNGLIAFLKFHKNIMSNFWKNIGKTAMLISGNPEAEFLNDSIIKLDYDHNRVLDYDTKASRIQAKERYMNFVKQELPFLSLELDSSLKDDFLDYTKNQSARSMASFFATTIKLVSILSAVPASVVLETPVEFYDKLSSMLTKILDQFNKRFARISRFPTYDSCAKQILWKLAYWTYNIMPYKDCSFEDENEYIILDLFWQSCKNLGKNFQISTQRIAWPNNN